MPYKSTSAGKTSQSKPTNRRYRRRRRRPTMYGLSKRINWLSKHISTIRETKHSDRAFNIPVPSSATIYSLTDIQEGDSETQRTGITINPRTLRISFRCTAEAGEPSNELRFLVFRWFDSGTPSVSDILAPTTAGIFSGYTPIDVPTNYVQNPAFQILSDKKLSLDPESNDTLFYKFMYRFRKNAKINWNGSSSTAFEKGNVFILVASDSVAIPHPLLTGYSRLTFKDS